MTKIIPILSGRCLVVELPEGATHPRCLQGGWTYNGTDMCTLIWHEGGKAPQSISIPVTGWRIIGMLSEVTEVQAALVVPIHRKSIIWDIYKNFKTDKWDDFDALESLESAILAEGYYLGDNPLGNRPEMDASTDDDLDDFDFPNERGRKKWDEWEDEYKKWNEAKSRVLDRSRCLLLGREV